MLNNNDVAVQSVGDPFTQCKFEISPFAAGLAGTISATVYEGSPTGEQDSTGVISTEEPWYVEVEWTLSGRLLHHLCGEFCLCLSIESIGPGDELKLTDPCHYVEMDPCGDGSYSHRISVDAGRVNADECGTLYLLGLTLTSRDACGNPGHFVASCTGPTLMFYNPPEEG